VQLVRDVVASLEAQLRVDDRRLCPCKSVDESVAYGLEHDLCPGPSRTWTDGTITATTHAGCFANNDVVLISIAGGGHNWPSIGTDAAWSFFSKHSRTVH
jgi:poly(3-hydroxybutyrate) depolymerase